MGTVIEYAKKYGKYTFAEKEFNEVDNLILSGISYIIFDDILNGNNKITLHDAAEIVFLDNSKKEIKKNTTAIISAFKLLKAIKDTNRFKDLLLYNYIHKYDDDKQFCALFIDINPKLTYISFEGTDELISGWKEDAELAYLFPVPSHKEAIRYINKKISILSNRKYLVGGHSKGGNLALVASMYANPLIRGKIEKIYMNDAPGLKNTEINSRLYKSLKQKIIRIIPNTSVVGLLLYNDIPPKIVLSNTIGFLSHNFLTWQVIDNHFIETYLSDFSKKFDKTISKWINTYSEEQIKVFVADLFDVLNRANINSLLDIKSSAIPSLYAILKESKKINKESKTIISELLKLILEEIKTTSSSFIHNKLSK